MGSVNLVGKSLAHLLNTSTQERAVAHQVEEHHHRGGQGRHQKTLDGRRDAVGSQLFHVEERAES